MKKRETIVLGMSGGVDSSVCALLLKKQGYNVIGVFMQNWDTCLNNDILGHKKDHEKQCNVSMDYNDAKMIAEKLNIPLYKVDFIKEYWENVFKNTLEEYKKGITPNPDVLCNKYIKFQAFRDYVAKKFKCNKIAMGHYANVKKIKGINYLTKAKDELRDQTYFLCYLNQKQIDDTIFPIGNLTKEEVREIAKKNNLHTWNRKNSTGICFIGERDFNKFLLNYIKPKSGKIIDVCTNSVLGTHTGINFYTIGQNKNLGLGGNKTRYFVCDKNIKSNVLYVCASNFVDKYLSSTQCLLRDFNWINGEIPLNKKVDIRFRHRQELIRGEFSIDKKTNKFLLKYIKTNGVTPGQFAVLYQKDICLGGGIVVNTIPTL